MGERGEVSGIYPVSCGSCKQDLNIELVPYEAKILRFCPVCGERSLYWRSSPSESDTFSAKVKSRVNR